MKPAHEAIATAIILGAFFLTLFAAAHGVPHLLALIGFMTVGLLVTAWVGYIEIKEARRGRR